MKIIVLGAGLVGAPMAHDLAKDADLSVTVADISETALDKFSGNDDITTRKFDLSDRDAVGHLMNEFDMAVNAVPGFMGFQTLEAILKAGKNVVDIAFFPEDPFQLDGLAKKTGVTAVIDCGVAPGMSNILISHSVSRLDECKSIITYVGGLPVTREWPYEYKAVFSPIDVIEEYTRPAWILKNGERICKPALSEPEYIDFPGIGTLEAFNTDGLRTLATTMDVPDMKEKTLRYPGHIEKMILLRETGFFDQEEIEINGVRIRPVDFTSRVLFPKWKMKKGEEDLTVMQVFINGKQGGNRVRHIWDLHDRYDSANGVNSMAKTTGYTATIVLRLIARGMYTHKGISPPEYIGKNPEHVAFILSELADRGVHYQETIETL